MVNRKMLTEISTIQSMFGPRTAQVFTYIVENIYCTREEIELGVYGRILGSSNKLTAVHLAKIKTALARWTIYQLHSAPSKERPPSRGKPKYVYKITLKPPAKAEGNANVTPEIPPRV